MTDEPVSQPDDLMDGRAFDPYRKLYLPTDAISYVGWVKEPWHKTPVERLIVGMQTVASQRKTLPVSIDELASGSFPLSVPTGSIGFLDFRMTGVLEGSDYREDASISWVARTAIELVCVGIEPEYREKGHGLQLVKELAKLAQFRGVEHLVSERQDDANFSSLRSLRELGFKENLRFYRPGQWIYEHYRGDYFCYPFSASLPLFIPNLPVV